MPNARNPTKSSSFPGTGHKPTNPAAKVPYMRDTIADMSRLLCPSTLEHAGRELRGLPIRWDSYTVNQVLKTHPPMEMRRMGCEPTVVSYTAFMKVLLDHGRPREATVVYREMLEAGSSHRDGRESGL